MFQYKATGIAACNVAEVLGLPALGRYTLRFRLRMAVYDFSKHSTDPGQFVWFGGELTTPAGRTLLHPTIEQVGLQEQERYLIVDADLDHDQMRRLDEARIATAAELVFTLHLRALISIQSGEVSPSYLALQHRLPDSDWVKILAESGFGDRLAIDLLLTYPGQPEYLAKAALEVQHAQACYRQRDWRGTFTHCRRAFEHVPDFGKLAAHDRDRPLSERLCNAYAAIRDTLHVGPHTGLGDPGPEDARRVLLWTSAMLDDLNRLARARS